MMDVYSLQYKAQSVCRQSCVAICICPPPTRPPRRVAPTSPRYKNYSPCAIVSLRWPLDRQASISTGLNRTSHLVGHLDFSILLSSFSILILVYHYLCHYAYLSSIPNYQLS